MHTKVDKKLQTLALLITALIAWGVSHSASVDGYVDVVRAGHTFPEGIHASMMDQVGMEPAAVAVWSQQSVQQDEGLRNRLMEEAAKTRIEPIDARLDRIWRAIPGLNGREIDVDKTFRLASELPAGSPITYIYKDIPPAIGLDDLGAHPIYKGNPAKKMISLMINVAWGDEYLSRMLETLKKENVHATFFFDGTWLSKNLDTAKAIGTAGHELSNHAYTHKNMSELSRSKAEEEIRKTERLLEQIGAENKLFAPPSGNFDQETVDVARQMKLRTILWTIDTVDWMKPEPEAVIKKVTGKLEPGAMILMHPTSSSMLSLEAIIKEAKKRGYTLGTVSELISPDRIPELETNLRK
jgi:probable sporulation protein (polysaccharide deacetylase family)